MRWHLVSLKVLAVSTLSVTPTERRRYAAPDSGNTKQHKQAELGKTMYHIHVTLLRGKSATKIFNGRLSAAFTLLFLRGVK